MRTVRALIELTKRVTTVKARQKNRVSHKELDLQVSADDPGEFSIFVRVNAALAESFSIGLKYDAAQMKTCVLLRVNGDHGQHRNRDGAIVEGAHVHFPSPSELISLPSAGFQVQDATAVPKAALLPQAWAIFCQIAHVQPAPEIAKAIGRLHTSGAQTLLFLEDDDDGS